MRAPPSLSNTSTVWMPTQPSQAQPVSQLPAPRAQAQPARGRHGGSGGGDDALEGRASEQDVRVPDERPVRGRCEEQGGGLGLGAGCPAGNAPGGAHTEHCAERCDIHVTWDSELKTDK